MKKMINTTIVAGIMIVTIFFPGIAGMKNNTVQDGYIAINECIPLDDISYWFTDNYGYPCFSLKDVGCQLDNPDNKNYMEITKNLEDKTEEFKNNYIDMRDVVNFEVKENGLVLYLEDGSEYFWEK